MKITRIVNGEPMEFELTPSELTDAYQEKEMEYDKLDCQEVYDLEFEDCSVEMTDEILTWCAKYYRKEIDDSGDWYAHARSAVSYVIYFYTSGKTEQRGGLNHED